MKVSRVIQVRVGDSRMEFRQKFWEHNDVGCLRDQTSKIKKSIRLFSSGALQVDEVRYPLI